MISERGQLSFCLTGRGVTRANGFSNRSAPTASVVRLIQEGVSVDNAHSFRLFDLQYPLHYLLPPLDYFEDGRVRIARIPYWLMLHILLFHLPCRAFAATPSGLAMTP